jgi:hypothetical protein
MKGRTFAQWLSSLTDRTAGIRVELGNKSTAGGTLGILQIAGRDLDLKDSVYVPELVESSELAGAVDELARGGGWPEEIRKMRLYALDSKGRNITSFQKTESAKEVALIKSDTVIMFEQMSEMMSRQLSTIERLVSTQSQSIESLSDANSHAMSTTIHMIDGMIESREFAADTAAANAYLETMLTDNSEAAESPFVGLARDALSAIGMGGENGEEDHPEPGTDGGPDIGNIKKRMEEDFFFRKDLENMIKESQNPEIPNE